MVFPLCLICYEECGCNCTKTCRNTELALVGKSERTWLNFVCAPLALCLHSFYAYFLTCVWVYTLRAFNHTCCFLCLHKGWLSNYYDFQDKYFPPDDNSLGKSAAQNKIEWKRASEVLNKPVLLQRGVEPSDVIQGNIGNCWLMSAISCMAEFPGLVDKVFLTREFSTRGKYQVTLYNGFLKKWKIITVDDFFPVKKVEKQVKEVDGEVDLENYANSREYEFEYAETKGKELWVLVLEKAFAKFRGSYENLSGGNSLWAFECLTGGNVFRLMKDDQDQWERFILTNRKKPGDISPIEVASTKQKIKAKDLFDLLRTYDRSKSLLSASVVVKDEQENTKGQEQKLENGLVRGHAYSILQVKRVKDKTQEFELLQLRNPWGEFEWKGKWSDGDKSWMENSKVLEKLGYTSSGNDGLFWMEMEDFLQHFDNIDFCDRQVDYSDFYLDVHENRDDRLKYWLGPLKGCALGYFDFWCKGEGVSKLYCGNEVERDIKDIEDKGGRDGDYFFPTI